MPASARDWTIYVTDAGEILEIPKAEGDEVNTGDILVKFQYTNAATEIMARQSQVADAVTRVDAAKADLTKMSAMFDRGYTARNTVDQARSTVASAELDLAHARQQLDIANAEAERAIVRARFPGVIAKRSTNQAILRPGR